MRYERLTHERKQDRHYYDWFIAKVAIKYIAQRCADVQCTYIKTTLIRLRTCDIKKPYLALIEADGPLQ